MKYVAFLRAINVGGRNIIRMADLRTACEGLGFGSVTTYVQSGNVLFESPEKNEEKLATKIEAMLNKMTGGDITVMLRSLADMQRIVDSNPSPRTTRPTTTASSRSSAGPPTRNSLAPLPTATSKFYPSLSVKCSPSRTSSVPAAANPASSSNRSSRSE